MVCERVNSYPFLSMSNQPHFPLFIYPSTNCYMCCENDCGKTIWVESMVPYTCVFNKQTVNLQKCGSFLLLHCTPDIIRATQSLYCVLHNSDTIHLISSGSNIWSSSHGIPVEYKNEYLHQYSALPTNI